MRSSYRQLTGVQLSEPLGRENKRASGSSSSGSDSSPGGKAAGGEEAVPPSWP